MLWWGYVHENGTYQVKRFFSREDLDDARSSPFVDKVVEPFDALNREDALKKLESGLKQLY